MLSKIVKLTFYIKNKPKSYRNFVNSQISFVLSFYFNINDVVKLC